MQKSTRQKLLETAFHLFYRQGYNGTGIDQVLKTAGVNKGSLYHLFKGKKALLLAVIDEIIAREMKRKYVRLARAENPRELLFTLLRNTDGLDFRHGCPLGNLVQEVSPADPEIAAALARVYREMERYFAMAFREVADEQERKELAELVVATLEGAVLASKSADSSEPYFRIVARLERLLASAVSGKALSSG